MSAHTPGGCEFGAYEIHMGRTDAAGLTPFAHLSTGESDGACGDRVWGTYLHGALENRGVVRELFGIEVASLPSAVQYNRLADWFRSAANLTIFEDLYL